MARRTLIDFFDDLASLDGEFLVYDDGYRTWSLTYGEVGGAARAFAGRLRDGRHRQGTGGRHLEREPSRVDRRALGLPARRRRARPDRLPRVGDVSRARRRDRRRPRRSSSATSSTPRRSRGRAPGLAARRARIAALRRERLDVRRLPARISSAPTADADRRRYRRDHLHLRRHRRSQGRRHHPPQHPREHRADRARDREVSAVGAGRSCRSAFSICCRSATCSARRWRRSSRRCCRASSIFTRSYSPDDIIRQIRDAPRLGARVRAEDARRPARARRARRAGDGRAAGAEACTGWRAGGTTGACTGCSASSSGRSSSAPRRSIRSSKRSGAGSALSSFRATASPKRRRSSR